MWNTPPGWQEAKVMWPSLYWMSEEQLFWGARCEAKDCYKEKRNYGVVTKTIPTCPKIMGGLCQIRSDGHRWNMDTSLLQQIVDYSTCRKSFFQPWKCWIPLSTSKQATLGAVLSKEFGQCLPVCAVLEPKVTYSPKQSSDSAHKAWTVANLDGQIMSSYCTCMAR